ncbi:MAG: ATP-binding protein [Planctomycetota bacterium]|nr:ATP-binding protein [Planctomycetota bacterium]
MDPDQTSTNSQTQVSTQEIAAQWLKDEDLKPYDDIGIRHRRLARLVFVSFVAWTLAFIFHLSVKDAAIGALCDGFGALSSCLGYFWLRQKQSNERIIVAGHFNILVTILTLTAAALITGQSYATSLWFLPAAPLAASYGLNKKAAYFWACVSGAAVIFVHLSALYLEIPRDWQHSTTDYLFEQLILIAVVLLFGLATRTASTEVVDELERRESIILNQARANKFQSQALEITTDKALAAAKAKSEFLANMSHEIRTPLNGVLGMTAMLETTPLNEEQVDILKTIQRSGELLLTIVNDVVDLSKIESGQLTLESVSFPLWDFVEETLELFSTKSWDKKIDLYCRFDPKVPTHIFGDPTRFRQILLNLIGNALKFTDEGEIAVLVDRPKDQLIQVKIRDTGLGIPKDKLDRLFKNFSQVDASTTRKFGGSGLGLAISKRLVELMGGGVSVESEPGKGSTFTFYVKAEAAIDSPLSSSDKIDRSWAGKKVLIIEPFQGSRELLKETIEKWSVVTTAAANLEDGLAAIRTIKGLSIIFVSARLKNLPLALTKIKTEIGRSKLVLLTSSGDSVYHAKVQELGFVASVLMPLRRKYVQRALQTGFMGMKPKASTLGISINPNFARNLPLSILVAEDNRTNQKVIQMVLKKLGYSADIVANGLEAIEALKSKDYDVILMDMHMPEMDGLTATKTIRKDFPEDKQAKIIALTANVLPEQKMECLDSGMDDFVGKPLQIQELTQALTRCAGPS